ncbi:MAG: SAM-dependent methyltransferase [Syntrophus sp. (in: bacteria)]|nr:SAM-dependent methyltransferase [Syntrophus sp. (in: bacteria)]
MDREALAEESDETVDEILGGRLRIFQKKTGYRFSLDALLLAHFASLNEGDDLIDLGTGSGIVAMILAGRYRCGRVLGIEIQEQLAMMARRSADLNGLDRRVEILQADVRRPETLCVPLSFDAAVFNPPYRKLRSGRMNPDPEKAVARHEIMGNVADFLTAAGYALRDGGRVYTIYPAARVVEILFRMRSCRIEPKRLRMVHSRPGGVGKFSLVEGVKGGREELVVLSPLYIYGGKRGYSAEMAAISQELSASPADGGD